MAYKDPPKEHQFKKGKGKDRDPRINRYGRPKSFDVLRKLAQRIAAEPVAVKNGYTVTRIEAMLLAMSSSKNPSDRKTFLEYAYGKVKDEIEQGGKVIIEVQYKDGSRNGNDPNAAQ